MSTAARDDRMLDQASTPAATPVVPPPKLRRRPALVAGAIVAICLGAILAAGAWTSTTHTQEVLAARTTIARGSVIGPADLQRVRSNADPALHPLPASAYENVVGKRAALDIAGGGLLSPDATTSSALPPAGMSVVGIALTPAQAPALRLHSGDRVRIVVTPGEGGDQPSGSPQFTAARVVDSHTDEASGQL